MPVVSDSFAAIRRARLAVLSVALTYVLSVSLGIAMAGAGNSFALERRDQLVGAARSSAILIAERSGDHARAAILDFLSNLTLGGVVSTLTGIAVVGVYPIVAYRGWVGGIVSVDDRHQSRLADPARASYYLVTLFVQLIPYSIAGGMGVYLGIGAWRRGPKGPTWLGLPIDRLRDCALAYVVVAPLFLIASLWEFFA